MKSHEGEGLRIRQPIGGSGGKCLDGLLWRRVEKSGGEEEAKEEKAAPAP